MNNYEITRLDYGVTRFREKFISADWRCNIWHIQGRERDLIIDTGFGLSSLSAAITEISDRPIIAVCTHIHHDHAGGLCQFESRCGHHSEAKIFAEPSRKAIVADLLDASVIRKLPYEGFDIETWCYQPAPLTGLIDDGDIIDLGDRHFHIVHVPGHSPGSVAIFEPKTGIILTGDAIYDGVLYDHLFHSVPDQLVESLNKILSMDFNIVHAGHFHSFDKDRAKIIVSEYMDGKRSMLCPIS